MDRDLCVKICKMVGKFVNFETMSYEKKANWVDNFLEPTVYCQMVNENLLMLILKHQEQKYIMMWLEWNISIT